MRVPGQALANGFTMAGAMWCVWYLIHLSAQQPSPAVQGSLILCAMGAAGICTGRWVAPRQSLVVGALSGFVCGCVNLLWVVSYLTSSSAGSSTAPDAAAETALHPSTGLFLLGFLAMSSVAGAALTWVGAHTLPRPARIENVDWHARFAAVAAVLVFPLLMIGALVTSTGSGLAVPDWPGTYGTNMIMYPIGLMTRPRIVIEHGHRLFGMLVGLTTTVLMLQSVLGKRPAYIKYWAVGLFVLVSLQGYLGGRRVNDASQWLAAFHGVVAQAFFGLTVGYAVVVSPLFRGVNGTGEAGSGVPAMPTTGVRRLKVFAAACTHSLLLQLVFGAIYRHLRSPHALWAHIGFSIVVVIGAAGAGFVAIRLAEDVGKGALGRTLRRLGIGLVAVVFAQFLLGWAAFWVVQTTPRTVTPAAEATTAPQVPLHAAALPTLHQANGAALLALAAMTYAWSIRLKRGGRG